MKTLYSIHPMPETAENIADEFAISRADQDAFALRSQLRTAAAQEAGRSADELIAIRVSQYGGEPLLFSRGKHPRDTSLEALAKLYGVVHADSSATAGNTSGVNDSAYALSLASEAALTAHDLQPLARVVDMVTAGVTPRIMGFDPAPAVRKILAWIDLTLAQVDVIKLNEAFTAQTPTVTRDLGLLDDVTHMSPSGRAATLSYPLGVSGGRPTVIAAYQLKWISSRYTLCTVCIGAGQGIALAIECI